MQTVKRKTAPPSKEKAGRIAAAAIGPDLHPRGTVPLRLYVLLPKGAYRLIPSGPSLKRISYRDLRSRLVPGTFDRRAIASAPLVMVVTADAARLKARYGEKAEQISHVEAGRAVHRIEVAAAIQALNTSVAHVSSSENVRECLTLAASENALCIVCVGSA